MAGEVETAQSNASSQACRKWLGAVPRGAAGEAGAVANPIDRERTVATKQALTLSPWSPCTVVDSMQVMPWSCKLNPRWPAARRPSVPGSSYRIDFVACEFALLINSRVWWWWCRCRCRCRDEIHGRQREVRGKGGAAAKVKGAQTVPDDGYRYSLAGQ